MELKCRFLDDDWIGLKYTCYVTEGSITQPGTEIVAFTGVHKAGKTDNDVEGLWFYNSVVEFIPKDIAKHFPRLTTLVVQNRGLKEVKRSDLQGLENLEELYLANNKLTTLPDDLLQNMKKLRWIDLSGNLIEFMSSKLLEPIKGNDFQTIDFQGNTKINDYYIKNKHNTVEVLMATIDQKCTPPVASFRLSDNPSMEWFRKQEDLFATGKFSDFTIIVHEKEYKVHKIILATQSPVFERMLGEGSKSVQNLKEIKNFTENAFEDFLRYFYTGTVKSKNNAMEILELAAEFAVPDLMQICELIILEILDESNLLEVYNLGHARSLILKTAAFKGIQRSFPELKDRSIDNVELVNKLVKTNRLLDELKEAAEKADQ